ncbi:MAG: hypothetical protein ABI641_04750 [Caldimonas sp.]
MNQPRRPLFAIRVDSSTPLALAAGLVIGHVVAAMAESGIERTLALPSAFIFVVAGAAAVVCALLAMRERDPKASPTAPIGRWIGAIGAGLVAALAPGLF